MAVQYNINSEKLKAARALVPRPDAVEQSSELHLAAKENASDGVSNCSEHLPSADADSLEVLSQTSICPCQLRYVRKLFVD